MPKSKTGGQTPNVTSMSSGLGKGVALPERMLCKMGLEIRIHVRPINLRTRERLF